MRTKGTKLLIALVLTLVLLLQGAGPALAAEGTDFLDVPEDAYYRAAVEWAAEAGITQGTSAAAFSPEDPCTRGQVVTFLWRAAGKPEAGAENPFADVKAGAYYEQAVLWAVETGITEGTSADTFSPEEPCTRAHILTFLWRSRGRPGDRGSALWYADAVAWAEEDGLLSGTGEDYAPEEVCPRRDVVYYLWGIYVGTPELLSRGGRTMRNVSYVMIYNPLIWSEEYGRVTGPLVSTGDLTGQVDTDYVRSAPLPSVGEEGLNVDWPRQEDPLLFSDLVDRSGARAGGQDPSYSQWDTHKFYMFDQTTGERVQRRFTCVYAGKHCYIWSLDGSISESQARELGQEFDDVIYPADVYLFGQPRFTSNGGKVNVLFYPFTAGNLGYFNGLDNFATGEVPDDIAAQYGVNLDHAIINLNARFLDETFGMKSTLAHELQHLILDSDVRVQDKSPGVDGWLNEAMSTYAEDAVYPGADWAKGYIFAYFCSDSIRNAQSMYNFDASRDNGCYGGVRLFSRYFSEYNSDIFWYVHEFWRTNNRASLTTAEALYSTSYIGYRQWIDANYRYSRFVNQQFRVLYDEWLSKVTLDFYLRSFDPALCGLSNDEMRYVYDQMLYTSGGSVNLEGGGRIIVPVNGTFTVPEDAGSVLVYIGLDQYFNAVDAIGLNETGAPQTPPVQQHSYSFFCEAPLSWHDAWQEAKARGGYLCTLDSEEEFLMLNNYIEEQGWTDIAFRIGGFRPSDSRDYYWVNSDYSLYGEPLNGPDYWMQRYWFYGEPDGYDPDSGTEAVSVAMMLPSDLDRCGFYDISETLYSNLGFIIEFDN